MTDNPENDSTANQLAVPQGEWLEAMTTRIQQEEELFIADISRALSRALRIGDMYLEAKVRLGYGGFLPYVEKTSRVGARQVQNFMAMALDRTTIEAGIADGSIDTITDALTKIKSHKHIGNLSHKNAKSISYSGISELGRAKESGPAGKLVLEFFPGDFAAFGEFFSRHVRGGILKREEAVELLKTALAMLGSETQNAEEKESERPTADPPQQNVSVPSETADQEPARAAKTPKPSGHLTADEKATILRLHDAGYPQWQIADRLGRNQSTISKFLTSQGKGKGLG